MPNSSTTHPEPGRRQTKSSSAKSSSQSSKHRQPTTYQDTFRFLQKENTIAMQAFPNRPSAYIQHAQYKNSFNKVRMSNEGQSSWLGGSHEGSWVASGQSRRVYSAPVSHSYPGHAVVINGKNNGEFIGRDWLKEYRQVRTAPGMKLSRGFTQTSLHPIDKVNADGNILEFVKKRPYTTGQLFQESQSKTGNPLMVKGHGPDAIDAPRTLSHVQAWDTNQDGSHRGSDCPSPLGSKLSAATPTPVASDSEDEGINSMAEEDGPSPEMIFTGNDGMPEVINRETGPVRSDDTDYEHAASHMLRYYMRLESMQKDDQNTQLQWHKQNGSKLPKGHQTNPLSIPETDPDQLFAKKYELPSARTPRRLGGGRLSRGRAVYSTLHQIPDTEPHHGQQSPPQCVFNSSFIQIHKPLPQPRPSRKTPSRAKSEVEKCDMISLTSQDSFTHAQSNKSAVRITAHVPVMEIVGSAMPAKDIDLQVTSLSNL